MASLNVNIPDSFFSELSNISSQLKQTPEQCLILALHHFFQTSTVENAIEGIARIEDGATLVNFPELKEEIGIDIQFHPQAMEELETLETEDQMEVLSQLIERLSTTDKIIENTLDLVLKEQPNGQVILSGFDFGDIVYQMGQNIILYHLAFIEDDIDDEEDELEEDDEEFIEEDELEEGEEIEEEEEQEQDSILRS